MKTIISTILTIAVMISSWSCRQQGEDEKVEITHVEILANKGLQKNAEGAYKLPDSETSRDTINVEGGIIISDPPPKDRDQWKIKN